MITFAEKNHNDYENEGRNYNQSQTASERHAI